MVQDFLGCRCLPFEAAWQGVKITDVMPGFRVKALVVWETLKPSEVQDPKIHRISEGDFGGIQVGWKSLNGPNCIVIMVVGFFLSVSLLRNAYSFQRSCGMQSRCGPNYLHYQRTKSTKPPFEVSRYFSRGCSFARLVRLQVPQVLSGLEDSKMLQIRFLALNHCCH